MSDLGRAASGPATRESDFSGLARDLQPLLVERRLEMLNLLTKTQTAEALAFSMRLPEAEVLKHVEPLLEIGIVRKEPPRPGVATEYALAPQKLFALSEEFGRLGAARGSVAEESFETTQVVRKVSRAGALLGGPSLTIVHGMKIGHVFRLSGAGPWPIGRDAALPIGLDYDPFSSTKHAEITQKDGQYALSDSFSKNGTFLNWERLPRGWHAPLNPGDVVGVGKSLLVFRR